MKRMRNVEVLFEDSAVLLTCEKRILVVSDIHLGYEIELAKKGLSLPKRALIIAEKLNKIGREHKVDNLLILGDIKHKVAWASFSDSMQVRTFFNKLQDQFKDIMITLGNHDGGIKSLLPSTVKVAGSKGVILGYGNKSYALLHGHAWPKPESINASCIIIGHGHYMIELKDSLGLRLFEPVWLIGKINRNKYLDEYPMQKSNCKRYAGNIEIIILPAFNRIVGGIPINKVGKKQKSPLFKYLAEEETKLYLMDGTYLTTLSGIKEIK